MGVKMDEDDADMDDIHASSNTNMAPCSTIHILVGDRTNSRLYAVTPNIISDFKILVTLVHYYIREKQPGLEITVHIAFFL